MPYENKLKTYGSRDKIALVRQTAIRLVDRNVYRISFKIK